ncbi:uncharacterized protein B0H18DRAFT_292883 [Fomitopsis serialis]|uniref:uncharacterized protein n=1 Tax=Fomitopsis serialis TaxID=139415 RepID=UPI002007633D|nr:uncharacterized protein B0H18DRAFT_292883 [Neoantrodia serialis]KAH9927289.1 hypothetical protein B0H18DRAFT_292883 [Neoantrodia serialis]
MSPSFYGSSPPVSADRRSLTAGAYHGSGFPSYVAPRLFAPSQGLGAAAASDTWNPKAATATNVTKHNDAGVTAQVQPSLSSFVHNHNHTPPPPPRGPPVPDLYSSPLSATAAAFTDRDPRDLYLSQRHLHQQPQQHHPQPASPAAQLQHPSPQSLPSPTTSAATTRSTLWWGELEPWMDEEYAKQVCSIMGWDPLSIKVPRPAPDPITGQQANNPGYCFLTFPSQSHAASVLSQINNNTGNPIIMPNSSKPFSLNWASSVPSASMPPAAPGQTITLPSGQNPQYPKEYSIFVGDLAPEVSNSDLVAVFRNPVLGLRNDREPRFIRPFLSCKSAKIMLDPVTGVSRGYGFVRFTDEADQQRALVEMHGLYCLSRPMRISPATAKFKPAPGMAGVDFSQMPFPLVSPAAPSAPEQQSQVTVALPLPNAAQAKSVSAPLAGAATNMMNGGNFSNSSSNASSLGSGTSATSSSTLVSAPSEEAMKFVTGGGIPVGGNTPAPSVTAAFAAGEQASDQSMAQKFNISEESWKHHAQARAILSNLIGPNGEQLTSSDPYNTTVFVGGLSPLISEDTLRTFFAPFGDIHYVKVPVGKHCGFVQFVRKPDAERAIEKMQGFPIGGSRIRLSWGRSQSQAAAQAAQAAAFQAQYQTQLSQPNGTTLTPEQAIQLLERFGISNFGANGGGPSNGSGSDAQPALYPDVNGNRQALLNAFNPSIFGSRPETNSAPTTATGFSPFSPDPNYLNEGAKSQDPASNAHQQPFSNGSNASKGYPAWYNPSHDEKVTSGNGKISPTSALHAIRPPSTSQRFNTLLGDPSSAFQSARSSSRQEAPISRPDLTRKGSQTREQYGHHEHEQDTIQDLNGTLASLDLNNSPGMWMSGDNTNMLTSSSS